MCDPMPLASSTHINGLNGWNHTWNENSRVKNSGCWMELNFSATERKLYGLIISTILSWFKKKQNKNLWQLLTRIKWVLTRIDSFSKELKPSRATAPALPPTRWLKTFLKMGALLNPEVWIWLIAYLAQKIWIGMHSDCVTTVLSRPVICVNYWWK